MKKTIKALLLALFVTAATSLVAGDIESNLLWVSAPAEDRGIDGIKDLNEGDSWIGFRDNYKKSRDHDELLLPSIGNPMEAGVVGRSSFYPQKSQSSEETVFLPYGEFLRSIGFNLWKGRLISLQGGEQERGNRVHTPISVSLSNGWYTRLSAFKVVYTSSDGFYNASEDTYNFSAHPLNRFNNSRSGRTLSGEWIGGSSNASILGREEEKLDRFEYIGIGNSLRINSPSNIAGNIDHLRGVSFTCTLEFRVWRRKNDGTTETQLITKSSTLKFLDYPSKEKILKESICFQKYELEESLMRFSFPTVPGAFYFVEQSTDIENWARLDNRPLVIGTGYDIELTRLKPNARAKYFRLQGVTLGDSPSGTSARVPRFIGDLKIEKDVVTP